MIYIIRLPVSHNVANVIEVKEMSCYSGSIEQRDNDMLPVSHTTLFGHALQGIGVLLLVPAYLVSFSTLFKPTSKLTYLSCLILLMSVIYLFVVAPAYFRS